MRKLQRFGALIIGLSMLATACGQQSKPVGSASMTTGTSTEKSTPAVTLTTPEPSGYPVTVTATDGSKLTIPAKPQRVVLLNPNAADAVRIFGADRTVVATGGGITISRPHLSWPSATTTLNGHGAVSAEAVAATKPDLVIAQSYQPDAAFGEHMRTAGIRLLRLNLNVPATQQAEFLELAKAFDATDIATAYLAWRSEVSAPLGRLANQEKVPGLALSGFAIKSGKFRIFPANFGEGYLLGRAGVTNMASELAWDGADERGNIEVGAEYVAARDPQVLTFSHATMKWGGYQAGPEAGKALLDIALADPVVKGTKAAANKRILVLHNQIGSTDKRFVGELALAKMLHPQLFADVHPNDVLKQYFEKWLKVPFGGHWMYPEIN